MTAAAAPAPAGRSEPVARTMTAAALLLLGAADLVFLNGWVFPRVIAERQGEPSIVVRPLVVPPVAVDRPVARVPDPLPVTTPLPTDPVASAPTQAEATPDLSVARPRKLRQVYFAHDQHALDDQSQAALRSLAARALGSAGTIVIDGHTDRTGPEVYNAWLSQQRAVQVSEQLVGLGVPRDKIVVRHYGSTRPAVVSDAGQSVRRNRRVEIGLINGGNP